MTKGQYAALERIFGCEIFGIRYQWPRKTLSPIMQWLLDEQMIEQVVEHHGAMTVEYYELTHRGRILLSEK